ncbi:hypothetical protein OU798_10225 [Prolixibacteraceae bacterium Z1-6]|uniref:Uncharacterized protein n=1 Tax=Draconibacterium aestuarii TaxID=2998507 RepID=A0A9X3J6Q3_9BACT|nr:hypothetical protein [Prolixibacteraceae bacterium Z1-6]
MKTKKTGKEKFDYKTNYPSKPYKWPPFIKLISWILIVALLNLTGACKNYFKVTESTQPVSESLDELQQQNKTFILHLEKQTWEFEDLKIVENELRGNAYKTYQSPILVPVVPNKPNRYDKKSFETRILNEVHIYTSELNRTDYAKVAIPLSAIQRVEIYEKDKKATNSSYILGGIGIGVLAYGLLVIIVALTKSSCPFIYDLNQEEPQLIGEIYSGSVQPALERHDFLPLPYSGETHEYKLKITNEAQEIQHTNLMELWYFEGDTSILTDKYGNCSSTNHLLAPEKVTNLKGEDVLNLIREQDQFFYTTNEITGELSETDGIVLEFPKPENTENAKLVIRAKNSIILDYMMGQFQMQFGDLYHKWGKRQKKASREDLMQWSYNQNVPLALAVERNGEWETIDHYNLVGPMTFKKDILSIPLDGTESDPLRVKLEAGNFFWEIDYAAIDYSPDQEINYRIIPVQSAITQNGNDVCKLLRKDDKKYYTQPEIGDEAIVTFNLPATATGEGSLLLHSKGWYQIIRNPSGKADREYLETFRNPGRFNEFVNDHIQSLTGKE